MSEKVKIPKVATLDYIAPTPDSARADVFEYEKIDGVVEKHRPFEYQRLNETFEADVDSLEEWDAARQQAFQYLLFTVGALKYAATPEARELWSDRYTQATSELYDTPDPEVAKGLFEQQRSGEIDFPFKDVAAQVGEYFETTYADVYNALDLDNVTESISMESVADRIEAGLAVLAGRDEAWADWTVSRDYEKSQLSIKARPKKIVVGMRGVPIQPSNLKGLFTHEVFIHAQRALNDQKVESKFDGGLPGYLDADEGLGVFAEYAVTGTLPQRIIDRYVDIAYALGTIDGEQHTRNELLEIARERALYRNEKSEHPKPIEDVETQVYNHVNRIYRGSRGDEHIGIYTKDIAYYAGFMKIGTYISERLATGESIDKMMTYLLAGRFDPTLPAHQEFVAAHLVK